MALGVLLLVGTAALFAYGQYERVQFEREQAIRDRAYAATATSVAAARVVPTTPPPAAGSAAPAPEPATTPLESATGPVGTAPAVSTAPSLGTVPPPTPTVSATIRRIVAKSIDLDAPVIESRVVNGEWQVPKFVAGHLEGTAMPGDRGNVVLSGHVQSLTSGNVFARLEDLKTGDEVLLKTAAGDFAYRIEGRNVVKNDDISVVMPTQREELTLITCTGTFNPLTQDYSHRLVVWGVRTA